MQVVGIYFFSLGFFSDRYYILVGVLIFIFGIIIYCFGNFFIKIYELVIYDSIIKLNTVSRSFKRRTIYEAAINDVVLAKKQDIIYNKKAKILNRENGGEFFAVLGKYNNLYFNLDEYAVYLIIGKKEKNVLF